MDNVFWYFEIIILETLFIGNSIYSLLMESKDTKKYSYLDEYKIIKNLGSGYHAQ